LNQKRNDRDKAGNVSGRVDFAAAAGRDEPLAPGPSAPAAVGVVTVRSVLGRERRRSRRRARRRGAAAAAPAAVEDPVTDRRTRDPTADHANA